MQLSAEIRWFWPENPPSRLKDWFVNARGDVFAAGGGKPGREGRGGHLEPSPAATTGRGTAGELSDVAQDQGVTRLKTKAHTPDSVPKPVGNYSLGLEIPAGARILFISGQIPETLKGDVPRYFEAQCNLVWDHIFSILQDAGMSVTNLVKVTTFLVDREYAEANGRIRRERLGSHAPALTVMVAQTLDPRWLLEIEALAAAEA